VILLLAVGTLCVLVPLAAGFFVYWVDRRTARQPVEVEETT